jgi:hypothetical protein
MVGNEEYYDDETVAIELHPADMLELIGAARIYGQQQEDGLAEYYDRITDEAFDQLDEYDERKLNQTSE